MATKKEKGLQVVRFNGRKYFVLGKWMYNENSKLGAGGFGAVYKGLEVPLEGQTLKDEYVAIKHVEIQEGIKNTVNNIELESVRQEIVTLQQLDHPNIVQLIDVKKNKDNVYMVMEFCQHGDLEQFFNRKKESPNPKKLTELEIRFYFSQIIEAFKYLRSKNLIHRDIKPQNILVKNDVWKVADFGFAKKTTSNELTDFYGTLATLAPQVMLQNYNHKCDIYSLGATLYWILYNQFPYKETNQKRLLEQMEKNPVKCPKEPHYSEELKNIVERMLIFDQNDRIDWEEIFQSKIFKQKHILETGQLNVINIINYDDLKENLDKKVELWKGLNIDEIDQDTLEKAENKVQQQIQQIDDKAKISDTVFRLQKRVEFEKGKGIFLRRVFERVGHYSVNGRVIFQKHIHIIKDLLTITRYGLYKYQRMCIKHIIDRLSSQQKQFDFTDQDWSYIIKSKQVPQIFLNGLQSDIGYISLDDKEMNKVAKKYQDIEIPKQIKDIITPIFWSNDYTYNVDFLVQLLLIIKLLIQHLYPELEKYKYANLQSSLNISDTLYLVDDLLIVLNLDNVFEWNESDIINFNTFLQQHQEGKTSQQVSENSEEAQKQFEIFNQVNNRVKLAYEIFLKERDQRKIIQ
ncbi:Serine/Threonine kinase domain protein (macronuclear) [Tetrahymena thermophila SB210]|uniref:Serine/Threonine kinase domain protein n=1 Tax=Tetrahymena thermophila (strain SB210) TaxID=312017 RepID=I7MLU4_TETTS|nr:Serine/Threonine kinase domain protein [Tetrahymena thermophila SB210]EAS03083.2 Serine/Threonine kinase domain protein [Tetrahymena thermophila SB210]|eukprot:XP_001023328.2 Serine/Threonine kinase domain protein [Tetrahymena thermophila SB210]